MGGNPSAGENRREKQAGKVRAGPARAFVAAICVPPWMACATEIVAAWSVEDGVRVVWEVAKMVVVVVVKVVLWV